MLTVLGGLAEFERHLILARDSPKLQRFALIDLAAGRWPLTSSASLRQMPPPSL